MYKYQNRIFINNNCRFLLYHKEKRGFICVSATIMVVKVTGFT